MKKPYVAGLGALALVASAAIGGSAQPATDAPQMSAPAASQDLTFVRAVQSGNDQEIGAARYVLGMTKSAQVRAFANDMVNDHSTANVELLKAARNAHVPVPQAMRRENRAMAPSALRGLAEPDLDAQYIAGQVTGHETMLSIVQTEEKSGSDPGLKAFASALEPAVQRHLDAAKNIVALGPHGGASTGAGASGSMASPGAAAPGGVTPNAPASPAATSSASPGAPTPAASGSAPAAPPTHAP